MIAFPIIFLFNNVPDIVPILERKIQTALSGSGIVGGCASFRSVAALLVAVAPPGRAAPGATIPTVP